MNKQCHAPNDDPLPENNDSAQISKSQRKRDADAIRALASQLAALGSSERASLPLSDDVRTAITELNRIKASGARKRQLGFLAKRLRQTDVAPIEAALEQRRQAARASTLSLHRVELWRDRLRGDVDGLTPKQALSDFLDKYPQADRQQLRHLQRQALRERQAEQAPGAARHLFRAIRDVISSGPDQDV